DVSFHEGYWMRLTESNGAAHWICLDVESRADAIWAAHALASACSDKCEDFDLWDGESYVVGNETKEIFHLTDTAEEVTLASQQSVLDTEEAILRGKTTLARSRKLLDATEGLRNRLVHREAQ